MTYDAIAGALDRYIVRPMTTTTDQARVSQWLETVAQGDTP